MGISDWMFIIAKSHGLARALVFRSFLNLSPDIILKPWISQIFTWCWNSPTRSSLYSWLPLPPPPHLFNFITTQHKKDIFQYCVNFFWFPIPVVPGCLFNLWELLNLSKLFPPLEVECLLHSLYWFSIWC